MRKGTEGILSQSRAELRGRGDAGRRRRPEDLPARSGPARPAPAPARFAALRPDLIAACGSLEKAFERMDVFKTGLVSCLEFQDVMSETLRISIDDAYHLFEQVDVGKRGVISLRDLQTA